MKLLVILLTLAVRTSLDQDIMIGQTNVTTVGPKK